MLRLQVAFHCHRTAMGPVSPHSNQLDRHLPSLLQAGSSIDHHHPLEDLLLLPLDTLLDPLLGSAALPMQDRLRRRLQVLPGLLAITPDPRHRLPLISLLHLLLVLINLQ